MKTILIADRDQAFCAGLAEYLRRYSGDLSVLTAGDVGEAVELLERRIDLVVADLDMESVDGRDFISLVKKNYPALPVYAAVEFMDMRTYKRFEVLGLTDYIIKPYDIHELLGTIAYLLEEEEKPRAGAPVGADRTYADVFRTY